MTREEAKDYIREYCPYDRQEEIIKALEQEPCEDATLKEIFCMGCEYKEQSLARPCKDAISRREAISIAGIATLSVNQVVAALKKLPSVKPKSECEHDHEILKAYSDGANDMLDNIKAEIANHLKTMTICDVEKDNGVIVQSELTNRKVVLYDTVLHIIDNYKAEGSEKE